MNPTRSSQQLHIRPYQRSDTASLFAAIHASIDALQRTLPWAHAGYAIGETELWIDHCLRSWETGAEYPLGIFNADGTVVGGTGLNRIDRANRIANLGYWVATTSCGQGVASAAARMAAEIGFVELGFHRIEIIALTDNAASNAVAKKLGAKLETEARNRLVHNGVSRAAFVYSLVPQDIIRNLIK
jgi:RimJ/RimL family protein N-acetyltransferase